MVGLLITLGSPNTLYIGLLIIVFIILIYYYAKKSTNRNRILFGSNETSNPTNHNKTSKREKKKLYLFIILIALILFSIANPKSPGKTKSIEVAKSDIMVVLDISNSMQVQDIPPSRLDRSKKFLENFILEHKSNRIGLIVMAGESFLQMPYTTDYAAAIMFVRAATPDLISTQGTDIGGAIQLAIKNAKSQKPSKHSMIIISDGEDHEDAATQAIQDAVNQQFSIFCIGVGTLEGGYIPTVTDGVESYITDSNGEPVISKFDNTLLKKIANSTDGLYFDLQDDANIIKQINARIELLEKRVVDIQSYEDFVSYYQYILFLAIVCLLLFYINQENLYRDDQ